MYTKSQFGKELEEELELKYDIVTLSRWAFQKYTDNREFEDGLSKEIMKIVAMEEGPEFEYTKEELHELALKLQKK